MYIELIVEILITKELFFRFIIRGGTEEVARTCTIKIVQYPCNLLQPNESLSANLCIGCMYFIHAIDGSDPHAIYVHTAVKLRLAYEISVVLMHDNRGVYRKLVILKVGVHKILDIKIIISIKVSSIIMSK